MGYSLSHSMYIGRIELATDEIHEFIISTRLDGADYAAPIGIRVARSGALVAKVYRGSSLWRACAENDVFALNVCLDPRVFIHATVDRSRLRFSRSKELSIPIVEGCSGYIECVKLGFVDMGSFYLLYLQPISSVVHTLRPYSRALGLSIEVLIELTRLRARVKQCDGAKEFLRECISRIQRVWSSDTYVELLVESLREYCGDLR